MLYPVKIELNIEISDPGGIFKIEAFNEIYKVVKKKNASGDFIPEYMFSEKERRVEEFHERCNYHQTNAASHFMQKRICSLPITNGRITLTGNILKITKNGEVNERILHDEEEFAQELWTHFSIQL